MLKFIKVIQLLILIVVGVMLLISTVQHGISLFQQTYVVMSIVLTILLEIAIFIIYKLIEDDFTHKK